ncbi:MAG: peptidase S41, partial [Bacteroidota bacterium]
SQSAVTAAQIQDYHWGTLVGEETGEYASLYASQFQYTLPYTGIPVKVSKGYIVRVNGDRSARGVMPDIVIKDHLLDEEDEILRTLLKRIKEGH